MWEVRSRLLGLYLAVAERLGWRRSYRVCSRGSYMYVASSVRVTVTQVQLVHVLRYLFALGRSSWRSGCHWLVASAVQCVDVGCGEVIVVPSFGKKIAPTMLTVLEE